MSLDEISRFAKKKTQVSKRVFYINYILGFFFSKIIIHVLSPDSFQETDSELFIVSLTL